MKTLGILLAVVLAAGTARGDGTILEVNGDKTKALETLRKAGYTAVSVKGGSYALPSVTITGPSSAKPGRMVIVSAQVDRTKLPQNLQQVRYQWAILVDGVPVKDFLVWPDGTQIIFSAPDASATVTVILDVDCLFGVVKTLKDGNSDVNALTEADMNSPNLAVLKIAVDGGEPPIPPPVPTPQPQPTPVPPAPVDPVFDPGKYGLAAWAYGVFKADASLSGAEKASLAAALAADYAAVGNSSDNNVVSLLTTLKAKNGQAVTTLNLGAKTSGVKTALGDKVYNLIWGPSPSVATGPDLRAAFLEIAAGLRGVK